MRSRQYISGASEGILIILLVLAAIPYFIYWKIRGCME